MPLLPSLFFSLVALTLPLTAQVPEGPSEPAKTRDRAALLLFVAGWCVPCRAELAQIKAIRAAAAPYRVWIVPIDRRRSTSAMLAPVDPALIWQPDPAALGRLQDRLFAGNAGLPFTAALDGAGRACGSHRGGISPQLAARLVRGCTGIEPASFPQRDQ